VRLNLLARSDGHYRLAGRGQSPRLGTIDVDGDDPAASQDEVSAGVRAAGCRAVEGCSEGAIPEPAIPTVVVSSAAPHNVPFKLRTEPPVPLIIRWSLRGAAACTASFVAMMS
jgi:hypothetical protein